MIALRSSKDMTFARSAAAACMRRPQMKWIEITWTMRITTITGARFKTKSLKDNPTCPPIRMFGGSPIRVDVPPMFDARICEKRNGYALTLSASVMTSVTGTTSSTVVTLSRNAEATAVTTASIARIPAGFALTSFADQIARYSKTPHFRVIETMIIMPTSRPMVLKSMPAIA